MLESNIQFNIYTTVLSGLAGLVVTAWWFTRSSSKLPPGPKGIPVFGYLFSLVSGLNPSKFPQFMVSLHQKYGDIVSFRAGVRVFVYIKDGRLIKQLFARDEFRPRPLDQLPFAKKFVNGTFSGVVFNNGQPQFEMRKFCLAAFRDFGVGKKSLDESVQSECEAFCQYLEEAAKNNGGIIDNLKAKCQQSAANVLHDIIFGFKYDYKDEKWIELQQKLREFFQTNFFAFPENYLPFLQYIPFVNRMLSEKKVQKFISLNQYLRDYIDSQIEEHKETYCEGEIRDFADLYIKYENETKEHYTRDNVFNTVLDIFRAGSDTTATTLAWCIQYLVKYPELQEELRDEIDKVVGDQVFCRQDKDKLIKTRAYINEILRYVTIASIIPPHTVHTPTKVGDYTLPANCFIFGSLYAMHHDKDYWKDPENFRIDRWIDDNGQIILHEDHFLPFGTGKRVCIGRQIALIEILLFLVSSLQNFKFEKVDGASEIDSDDIRDNPILRSPNSFYLKVTKR